MQKNGYNLIFTLVLSFIHRNFRTIRHSRPEQQGLLLANCTNRALSSKEFEGISWEILQFAIYIYEHGRELNQNIANFIILNLAISFTRVQWKTIEANWMFAVRKFTWQEDNGGMKEEGIGVGGLRIRRGGGG